MKYIETEQPENGAPDDSVLGDDNQGSEKKLPRKRLRRSDEGQGTENGGTTKRLKSSKKAVVLIESSGEET